MQLGFWTNNRTSNEVLNDTVIFLRDFSITLRKLYTHHEDNINNANVLKDTEVVSSCSNNR